MVADPQGGEYQGRINPARCLAFQGRNMMKLPRRKFLHLAAGTAALPVVSCIAWAQTYPTRPVRIIVGYPPGGSADVVARLIGQQLSERLGQSFVVENRPGAGTNIATEAVVKSAPDGYTLLVVDASPAINTALYHNLSFSFFRDIAPVACVMSVPLFMVVNPAVPAKTVPEFIAYAKANPRKVNMASNGSGGLLHLAGELFKIMTGVDLVHVPYRGAQPALTDVISGQVQVMFAASTVEYIKTGKVRALAVTTATHSEILPDVPALSEFVPGYDAAAWIGVGAPKNTPPEVIDKLNKEINAALADPKLKLRLADLGSSVAGGSAADYGRRLEEEAEKWGKVIRAANIKAE
jgi:tripartite-type tricarboxylate transporter receptor subunit TctC